MKEWAQSLTGNSDLERAAPVAVGETAGRGGAALDGLTQGGADGSPTVARAAIEEVTKALTAQQKKVEEGAAAAQTAAQRHSEAQEAALEGAKDRVKALDNEIKSLQDSIANEAVEEEMGIVERLTRKRSRPCRTSARRRRPSWRISPGSSPSR